MKESIAPVRRAVKVVMGGVLWAVIRQPSGLPGSVLVVIWRRDLGIRWLVCSSIFYSKHCILKGLVDHAFLIVLAGLRLMVVTA
jgi:hypothetical protein